MIGNAWNGIGASAKGIFVEGDVLVYNSKIDRNHINLAAGTTPKGIDIDATTRDGGLFITDNYVIVPNGQSPIESAMTMHGILHNKTLAGAVVADPYLTVG